MMGVIIPRSRWLYKEWWLLVRQMWRVAVSAALLRDVTRAYAGAAPAGTASLAVSPAFTDVSCRS